MPALAGTGILRTCRNRLPLKCCRLTSARSCSSPVFYCPACRQGAAAPSSISAPSPAVCPTRALRYMRATKAFLDAFSTSLHRELRGSGVQVSVVRPGPVKTEFFQTARTLPGGGSVPAERFSVSAERVAARISDLLEHPRRVVFVPGVLALSAWLEPLFGWLIDCLGPILLRHRRVVKPTV